MPLPKAVLGSFRLCSPCSMNLLLIIPIVIVAPYPIQKCNSLYIHTQIHAYIRTYTHACMHACMYVSMQVCSDTLHSRIHKKSVLVFDGWTATTKAADQLGYAHPPSVKHRKCFRDSGTGFHTNDAESENNRLKRWSRFRALIGFVWPARNGTASDTAAAGSDGSGSVLEPVPKLKLFLFFRLCWPAAFLLHAPRHGALCPVSACGACPLPADEAPGLPGLRLLRALPVRCSF